MDFDPLNEEAKFERVLKIKEACISTGFFSISNHGIPIEILEDCWGGRNKKKTDTGTNHPKRQPGLSSYC